MSALIQCWNRVRDRLPDELRLAGWEGPTLFTPEARDREPARLRAFGPVLETHAHVDSLVIGTVRETFDGSRAVYAVFCVQHGTGQVFLVDVAPPFVTRFVNTDVDAFIASLEAFVSAWPDYAAAADDASAAALARIGSALATIDAQALSGDDTYWSTWIAPHG